MKTDKAESLKARISEAIKSDTTKNVVVPFDTLGKEMIKNMNRAGRRSLLEGNILVVSDIGLLVAVLSFLDENERSSKHVKFIAHTKEVFDFANQLGVHSKLVPYDKLNLFFKCDKGYNYVTATGIIMKFDVVIGNPPYNPPSSAASGEIIWDKFVIHCWTILSENGYISFVTPSGWRHKNKKTLFDVYKIVTQHAICWSNVKHYFGASIGTSIDVDWWLVKKQNPIRQIQFLPRSSDDLLAMSIFDKFECFKGKKCVRLQNGFDRNEKSRGTFKLAQTSKHWLKNNWATCPKKSRTHDARKVIISSSGSTGAIYDDGNCSTSNHSHGIMVTDEKHALSVINTLNSKTARFIAQQLVSNGSLENPLLWIVNMLPDSNDIDVALSLTQEEVEYIKSMVK